MATSKDLYIELRSLRDHCGVKLYKRIGLAAHLLQDADWIADPTQGGGDEGKALDRLEDECFGDLCGSVTLCQLLEIYRLIPSIETWRQHKYNLRRMYAEYKERERQGKESKSSSTPSTDTARYQEGHEEAKEVKDARRKDTEIACLKGELKAAKDEVRLLRAENADLKRRIHKIQKMQEQYLQGVV